MEDRTTREILEELSAKLKPHLKGEDPRDEPERDSVTGVMGALSEPEPE